MDIYYIKDINDITNSTENNSFKTVKNIKE